MQGALLECSSRWQCCSQQPALSAQGVCEKQLGRLSSFLMLLFVWFRNFLHRVFVIQAGLELTT